MKKVKRAWDFLSEEQRRYAIEDVIAYFETERNEKIGVVAAENILDILLQIAGGMIYNRALDNIKSFLEQKFGDVVLDIDISLRKQIDRTGRNK